MAQRAELSREVERRVWEALNREKAEENRARGVPGAMLLYPRAGQPEAPPDAPTAQRSEAAKKGWETRRRHARELSQRDRVSGRRNTGPQGGKR